jgi:hypothetical protein
MKHRPSEPIPCAVGGGFMIPNVPLKTLMILLRGSEAFERSLVIFSIHRKRGRVFSKVTNDELVDHSEYNF